jgi:putative two-component system response regulator
LEKLEKPRILPETLQKRYIVKSRMNPRVTQGEMGWEMADKMEFQGVYAQPPFRVLIVDDMPFHRMLEKEILEAPKYLVAEAANGAEALEILRQQEFDVVLMDKRMPVMDGDEACRRIREDLHELMVPVIMVTGDGDSDNLVASMSAGATDFIRKPYNPVELVARVDAAVSHKRLTDQMESAESILFALARMVEAKDENTGDHCSRLAYKGMVFGQALGLGAQECLALQRGGVLHDIGKLGIPDSILLKPGKLTEEEWVTMRQHTTIGEQLCSQLRSMSMTVKIIRSHHERWDGSGYPDGIGGQEIPLVARAFQILDIHDALSYARPYKKAMSSDEVISILEDETRRGWRDPELMPIFLDLLRKDSALFEPPTAKGEDFGLSIFNAIDSVSSSG